MTILRTILLITFIFTLYSCNPKIITNAKKEYPPIDFFYVSVFNPSDSMPDNAEVIGDVRITNYDQISQTRYHKLVNLCKIQSANIGGNAIEIPKFVESQMGQEISANILHIDGIEIDTTSIIEHQKIILEYTKQEILPLNTITVNFGVGGVLPIENHIYGGYEVKALYIHTFKSGIGFGGVYSGFFGKEKGVKQTINYIAPYVNFSLKLNRFIVRGGLGFGIGFFKEKQITSTPFGYIFDLSGDYMITKNVGINISSSLNTLYFHKNSPINRETIIRATFTGGLSFYF